MKVNRGEMEGEEVHISRAVEDLVRETSRSEGVKRIERVGCF